MAYDWVETCKCSSNCKTAKARFCDWAIDNPLFSKAIEEALGDFVSIKQVGQQEFGC